MVGIYSKSLVKPVIRARARLATTIEMLPKALMQCLHTYLLPEQSNILNHTTAHNLVPIKAHKWIHRKRPGDTWQVCLTGYIQIQCGRYVAIGNG